MGGEPDEDHGEAGDDVDHVVIGGQDHCRRHRQGQADGEAPDVDSRRRAPDGNADEHVPAEVQARKRRVLVGQSRRLKRAVRVRAESDRVDERGVREPGRRDGEEGEEDEPDPARDEHRVAKQAVAVPAPVVEDHSDRDDHRPVAPDVDPVDDVDDQVAVDDEVLKRSLPVEAGRVFEAHDAVGVLMGRGRAARGEVSDAEVGEGRQGGEGELAQRVPAVGHEARELSHSG